MAVQMMKPLSALASSDVSDLRWVLTDVDDTITTQGKLHPVALQALWDLHDAGLKVVCVTGGSAGWADVYLRQWPLEAVIAESGTVVFERDAAGVIFRTPHPSIDEDTYAHRVNELEIRVREAVPHALLSSDQFARIYDVAWEVSPLSEKEKEMVITIAHALGASVAVSSIHINCWFAATDKYEGARSFLVSRGEREEDFSRTVMYCGDAPNDQVMFSRLSLSFGVGTVRENQHKFTTLPAFCASSGYGEGFSEIARAVIGAKRRSGTAW